MFLLVILAGIASASGRCLSSGECYNGGVCVSSYCSCKYPWAGDTCAEFNPLFPIPAMDTSAGRLGGLFARGTDPLCPGCVKERVANFNYNNAKGDHNFW